MSAEKIFGPNGKIVFDLVSRIIPKLTGESLDMDLENWTELFNNDPALGQVFHWLEILGRAYIASAATLVRTHQWMKAVTVCYEARCYLGFCGSLRGLIESAADSMHGLEGVSELLAHNHKVIGEALARKITDKIVACPADIEERLIHFTYARRASKAERIPTSHNALHSRDYLNVLKRFDPRVEVLYCRLCEIVHPAAASVDWMVNSQAGVPWVIKCLNEQRSEESILKIASDHRDAIASVVMVGFNYGLLNLKVLSKFDLEDLALDWTDTLDLSLIPAWSEIETSLR